MQTISGNKVYFLILVNLHAPRFGSGSPFLIQIQIKIQYSQMNADPCGFGSRSTTLQKTYLIRCKSGSKSITLQSTIFSFWISDLRSRGQYGTRSRIWICNAESKRILVFLTQKL
jgi:hypothetical protein